MKNYKACSLHESYTFAFSSIAQKVTAESTDSFILALVEDLEGDANCVDYEEQDDGSIEVYDGWTLHPDLYDEIIAYRDDVKELKNA